MDINQRLDVIEQGAELAQKAGVLTLDEAYEAKSALIGIKSKGADMNSINTLIKVLEKGRSNGVYGFQDCYYIYLAINGIESAITPVETPDVSKPSKKQSK